MPPRSTKAPKLTTDDTTPRADLAELEVLEELLALLLLGLLQPGPAGEHDVVAVLVELDDLGLEVAPDVGLQVAHPAQLDERCGQEPAQPDVEDEAALDDLDDRAGDDAVVLLDLLDGAPGPLVLGPLLGQDEPPLLVLLLEDERLDLLAERDDLAGIDVVADRELARGDDALGLVADVEQDLVLVDLDDGALHDVAVVELDDRAGDGVLEREAVEVVGNSPPSARTRRTRRRQVVSRFGSLGRLGGRLLVGLVGHAWGRLLSGQPPPAVGWRAEEGDSSHSVTDGGSYHPAFPRRGGTRGARGRACFGRRHPASPTTGARREPDRVASRRSSRGV